MRMTFSASQIPVDQVCQLFQEAANICALLPDREVHTYTWREYRDPFEVSLEIRIYPDPRAALSCRTILSCDVFLDSGIFADSLVKEVAATSKHIAAWLLRAYQKEVREIDRLIREQLIDWLREKALWWEGEDQ